MKNKLILKIFSRLVSGILGVVFLLAAFSKIGNLLEFQKAVYSLPFLPQWIDGLTVLCLPGLEMILGLCLITRIALREVAFIATCLLFVFLILSIQSSLSGIASNCHCFNIQTPAWLSFSGWWVVARNMFFLSLCGIILLFTEAETNPLKKIR